MITEIGDVKRFAHPRQLVSLLLAGKHVNKVKVACAREMVGFVWESLNRAAVA